MNYSTTELCTAFDVSASSYYYKPVGLSELDQQIMVSIKTISESVDHTYGKRRMMLDLNDLGYSLGAHKTKRLMNVVVSKSLCHANVITIQITAKSIGLHQTYWNERLTQRLQIRTGSVTLRIFALIKAGATWLVLWICIAKRLLVMPCLNHQMPNWLNKH